MFVISKTQIAKFNAHTAEHIKAQVYNELSVDLPQITEDKDQIIAWLDELIADGFNDEDMLHEAAFTLLFIGQRTDPAAAEARAAATAILSNRDHSATARLAFLRAQELTDPPEA